VVAEARAIAEKMGFDVSVLNDVDVTDCPPIPAKTELALESDAAAVCPPPDFQPDAGFDLDAYIAAPWYAQQLSPTPYFHKSENRCVSAVYEKKKHSVWGYEIQVHNTAYDVAPPHKIHAGGPPGGLCAKIADATRGKLEVGVCALPTSTAGPYWVNHWDDKKGFAIMSGGPPKVESNGKCKNDETKTNGSGFVIFTRSQARDEAVVAEARAIAEKMGFDVSVLNDVDVTDCPPIPAKTVEFVELV